MADSHRRRRDGARAIAVAQTIVLTAFLRSRLARQLALAIALASALERAGRLILEHAFKEPDRSAPTMSHL
jgi:hypothetical protein